MGGKDRLFGTDGVRGVANVDLTPELAFAVGRAGASVLASSSDRHRPIIVGRDTRLSGPMLEAAIVAGITSVGRDALTVGVVPTPAVAAITVRTGAAAGVVISASHNPIADNGIKFFGPDGFKLSDATEDTIESLLHSADDQARPSGADVGVAKNAMNLGKYYYEELYAGAESLSGLTVVVDGAFGAAYAFAPYALRKLGATVHEINCEDDGSRINVECGATDLRALQRRVTELNAGSGKAIGVAFDGDADRALFVDEAGAVCNGDHIMLILGGELHDRDELAGETVVGTVMSNLGLEKALEARGVTLLRAAVGDRYVLEKMRDGGYVFGGEQSGHIINLRNNTTGDGPKTAIELFSAMVRRNKTLHELASELAVYPQILLNVRTDRKDVLDRPEIRLAIREVEENLTGSGRLLIRPSGTEPLIRVMVEGDDRTRVEAYARDLAGRIEQAAATVMEPAAEY